MDDVTAPLETEDGVVLFTRRMAATDPWAAMLIVHGINEHSGRWVHVASFFAERGIETFSFDLRGHGRSGGSRMDIDRFSRYADDAAFVYETDIAPLGLPWVLYGHSMGGLIAAGYLLSDHPQPAAAVLSAPALDADVPAALRAAARVIGRVAGGVRLKNSIKPEHLSRDPSVGQAYLDDPLVDQRTSGRLGKSLLDEGPRVRERIAEISVRTLVIHGADDVLVPPHASAPLAASPAVDRKLYPGIRHELHNEPEQLEILAEVYGWIEAELRD